ncbi:FHA domain-containing protein [Teredinibacter sp. KSP-S5-2]|uniref:FHA domain-containing protein n=1 Tax=Teredinibacter sp. KSP-S5-2 TaxID=3034506 RepID=UPI0029348582|nr:FHA domain-containing protein [Teredinibacter sp. KSP-S5-2]WNO11109.1 FHA domain-containing protein [Teredinibacter sp. KSP-S5-2]
MITSLFLRSSETGESFAIQREMLIGREVDCTVVLRSLNISRYHAKILVAPNSIYVEDLSSSNGTFVNGRRVHSRTPVGVGDQIRFDSVEFRITTAIAGDADITQMNLSSEGRKTDEVVSSVIPAITPPKSSRNRKEAIPAPVPVPEPEPSPVAQPETSLDEDIDPFAEMLRSKVASGEVSARMEARGDDSDKTEMLSLGQRSSIRSINEQYGSELTLGSGPRLIVMTAPIRGKVYNLEGTDHGASWVIGRAEDADCQVDVSTVSRHHAKITRVFEGYQITALDASNGLQINGVEKTESALRHKDKILLGRVNFQFRTDVESKRSEQMSAEVTLKDWIPVPISQFYTKHPLLSAIIGGVATFAMVLGVMLLFI